MAVYEGANIQAIYFADVDGNVPAGTQVDVTFQYTLASNNPSNPLYGDVPVFFLQVATEMSDLYAPPNPTRTFYESQHYTTLPDDPATLHSVPFRVTIPPLSTAGNPAVGIWFATNATDPDLVSAWSANVNISSVQWTRVAVPTPPKLSIRSHSTRTHFH